MQHLDRDFVPEILPKVWTGNVHRQFLVNLRCFGNMRKKAFANGAGFKGDRSLGFELVLKIAAFELGEYQIVFIFFQVHILLDNAERLLRYLQRPPFVVFAHRIVQAGIPDIRPPHAEDVRNTHAGEMKRKEPEVPGMNLGGIA